MRQCVSCGNQKPLKEFYKASGATALNGYNRYCKHCCKVNRALEAVRKRDKSSKITVRQYYRAVSLGVEIEDGISLAIVFKRSLGICGLCGEWVPPGDASMDHVQPISKGGKHRLDNLQITHLVCNLRKGAKE